MNSELIYTDGSCVKNGLPSSTGGFGVLIKQSKLFAAPIRINRKGVSIIYKSVPLFVTNIRMEGLAIVSTMALYAKYISTKSTNDPVELLNSFDPYDCTDVLENTKKVNCDSISIVTDSQFWINVINSWMPSWIRKGIVHTKKNPDILMMLRHYLEWYANNNVEIKFIFVRSHQKGKRTEHADSNDEVDILAKNGASNKTNNYESS